MKEFLEPELNVLMFHVEDVITLSMPSEETEDNGPVVLPEQGFN